MTNDKNQLLNLNDAVAWWWESNGVEVRFVPRERHGGRISPEFDHILQLNSRHITTEGLRQIICADLYDLGYRFTGNQVHNGLTKKIWTIYLERQAYPEFLLDSPRVEFRRKPGRPRKDGTTRTIIVKHVE